jgi:P-aminobenzoate N-oxygenase AurF
MGYHYKFRDVLGRAERITWRVEDLIGGDKMLDFSKPFMPANLARTDALSFLTDGEKRTLNQIRGHAYLAIFGLVEEFILPFVLDHARPYINGEDYRARAFLEFAAEEAKHIHLFRRFREEFTKGFGTDCRMIGPAEAIARQVLSHHPLSVALAILQIEWMSQRHFQESIHDDGALDPQFKTLLKHHWMEEMQHAQLDTLMVETIAGTMNQAQIDEAIEGYLAIGGFLDEGLKQQTQFDLDAFMAAAGRILTDAEQGEFLLVQHQANRWTYLGSGMTHPNFLGTLGQLSPAKCGMIESMAPNFC